MRERPDRMRFNYLIDILAMVWLSGHIYMHVLKGWFTPKYKLPHDLLTLKASYVYVIFFFQAYDS